MQVTYTTQSVWFVFSHFDEWVGMFLELCISCMLAWNSNIVSSSFWRLCISCVFWWQCCLNIILRTR